MREGCTCGQDPHLLICETVLGKPPQPWPEVAECHWPAPSLVAKKHTCAQCDGSHPHRWVAGTRRPSHAGGQVPVRCSVCGGRKCDWALCFERRHHGGPHTDINGELLRPVGA